MPYNNIDVGIIGGSGFYNLEDFSILDEIQIKTPWGTTSDKVIISEHDSTKIAFLSRHGRGHAHSPSCIPYKANLAAMKMLGVKKILAFSACGSFQNRLAPGHFVVPNQIIDRTRKRDETFYNEGIVVHYSFGNPFTEEIADVVKKGLKKLRLPAHFQKTLLCIEGPAFSTRAESMLYKQWGADVINMTTIPEAKLARELEIAYQVVCMVTDYDSWRLQKAVADTAAMLEVLHQNTQNVKKILPIVLGDLIKLNVENTEARNAIKSGIITGQEQRPKELVQKYNLLFTDYF